MNAGSDWGGAPDLVFGFTNQHISLSNKKPEGQIDASSLVLLWTTYLTCVII